VVSVKAATVLSGRKCLVFIHYYLRKYDGGERSASGSDLFNTAKKNLGIPSVSCWVGVMFNLEVFRKNDFAPHRTSNLRPANA